MTPNFHRSAPIGHGGESILFIYRVLFAVHRNDLIYIPRQHNAVPPRYAYSSAEALAGLLSHIYNPLWDFPRVELTQRYDERLCIHTVDPAHFTQPKR